MKATAMAPSPAAEATHLIEPCRNVAGRKRAGNARLEEEGRPIERPDRGRSSLDLQVGAGHEIPAAVTDNRRRPGPLGVGSAADADEDTPGRHGSLHVNTAASCDERGVDVIIAQGSESGAHPAVVPTFGGAPQRSQTLRLFKVLESAKLG
jgi:hypothetical protein